MMPDITATVTQLTPRISQLGNSVVEEIAERTRVDKKIVMRAMLHVSLHHQRELMDCINEIAAHPPEDW